METEDGRVFKMTETKYYCDICGRECTEVEIQNISLLATTFGFEEVATKIERKDTCKKC